MTQEDKQLLLKDLCARLPYGVKVKVRSNDIRTVRTVDVVEGIVHFVESDSISPFGVYIEHPTAFRQAVKPFLRPMSSMTEEEKEEYCDECKKVLSMPFKVGGPYPITDWLNLHHFDHRGLIEKGLALEAPEEMYKTE